MNIRIRKRSAVRVITFSLAAVLFLAVFSAIGWHGFMKEKQQSTNNYQRSLLSLSESIDSIDICLQKTLYAGSAEQFAYLAAELCTDSAAAKSELSQLNAPVGELENINRFISQVSDYAVSLAKKRYLDEDLTEEELQQLRELEKYTSSLRLTLDDLIARSYDSGVWEQDNSDYYVSGAGEFASSGSASVMAQDFTEYPTLIYDGPFSDHIYDKKPMLIKDSKKVSVETAEKTANAFSAGKDIEYIRSVEGNLPLYVFGGGNTETGVTVQGGIVAYMINSREIGRTVLDEEEAVKAAARYLREKGFENMSGHYYEIYSDCCVVNFTYIEDGVVMYPDLIKVTVALDNGEIVEFDARDYIMNHHDRGVLRADKSKAEAEKIVSRHLEIENAQLAVIPADSKDEKLCWEFQCDGEDDLEVLVYVNAENLREEKILLILENEDSLLTV